jgi:hypothetical protein
MHHIVYSCTSAQVEGRSAAQWRAVDCRFQHNASKCAQVMKLIEVGGLMVWGPAWTVAPNLKPRRCSS